MIFKDLLDKYNNGNASEEEVKIIEEELNKHEAIEDYLSESYITDFEKDSLHVSTDNETTLVKRSVNKKLRKVILASVSTVFLMLFTIYFIVSPIVSSFYYNPSQKTVGKYTENLYFDLKVLTELSLPGYAIGTAGSEKLGFGIYNIYYERVTLFNRERKVVNYKIKKNLKIGNLQDLFPSDYFAFMDIRLPDIKRNEFTEKQNKEVINHINQLNPVSYISAYVLFKDDLKVKDFDELSKKYNDKVSFRWLGVRTEIEGKPVDYLSGFNPNFNDGAVSGDSADKNKYPYLQLADYMTEENNRTYLSSPMVEACTKHFVSLLKYVNDRENAVRALENNSAQIDYYKNALNYVEKNGINIYGGLVYGEAKDLLEFISNEKIKTIEINSVLPSKYIN
ncbi:anti sigma factor C-terminal domain-containing protein [Clostridium sp.]